MVFLNQLKGSIAPTRVIYSKEKPAEGKDAHVNFNERLANATGNYEPHNYGNEQNPLGFYGASFHLLKCIIGSGILALPYCFLKVGFLTGIVGVTFICSLYLHIMHVFLSVEYELCKRFQTPNLTYLGVVQKSFDVGPAFARKLKSTFTFLIYFNYVFNGSMCNASYLLIMGGNLKSVHDFRYQTNISLTYCLNFLIVPLILLCWIPKLKFIVPLSMVTNSFTLINIIIILGFKTAPDDNQRIKPVNDLYYLPQFCGIVIGAIACTGALMPVKNEMEKPKTFRPILNISVIASAIIYAIFATRAYFIYGQSTQGNVLLNLPTDRVSSMVTYSLYTITLCVSFTINLYVIYDTLWSNYLAEKFKANKHAFFIACIIKLTINVGSYVMATVIPNFETVASLCGSFAIFTEICLPLIMQTFVFWSNNYSFFALKNLKNIVIILLAFCSFLYAFARSISDVVDLYDS